MIDWLSWPLANHVDTWVIALLKGLAAVQKFTILIDATVLKIELVNTGSDGFCVNPAHEALYTYAKL